MSWDPALYLRFGDHRTRPAADLLARVPLAGPGRVVDLGCGPGNSTGLLAARWPEAALSGLDSSADMLVQARASGVPAYWVLADIATWRPDERFDLIFSNATMQWLGDQAALLPRLMALVAPGGVFAFQVPVNFDAPSHVLMREVAGAPRWAAALKDVRGIMRATAQGYYEMLRPHAAVLDIWQSEYLHVLEGEDAVYRWTAATGLRPFVQALDEDARADFVALYKARLNQAYPRRADGTTLFPFQRLFVVAAKG